ncbi:hypothetical protein WJX79_004376 [Trebouxia sp. C0005]
MSVSSIEQLRGGLLLCSRLSAHRSTEKGDDSSVSVVLPDSPKRLPANKLSTDALTTAQTASAKLQADSTEARAGAAGLFGSALLDAGPPRLSALGTSQSSPSSSSTVGTVCLPLRQSDFSRELDRMRQKWQARGNDKQASTSSELSDPSRHTQTQHQRPSSALSQQEGCFQREPLVQLCEGSLQSPRGVSRHQSSSAEADSPPSRSCSPRCRVAKAFRSPPKPGMEQDLEPRPLHSPAELPRPGPNIPGGHVMHPAEVAAPQDGAQQPGCPAATPVTDLAQACLVAEDIPSQPEEFSHAVLDGRTPSIADLLADARALKRRHRNSSPSKAHGTAEKQAGQRGGAETGTAAQHSSQAGMNGAEGSRPRAAALRAALFANSPSPNDVKKKQNRYRPEAEYVLATSWSPAIQAMGRRPCFQIG